MRWTIPTLSLFGLAAGYINSHGHDVVKTVTLPNGQVIDWVRKGSLGQVAPLPPFAPDHAAKAQAIAPVFDDKDRGPPGTVPIARSLHTLPMKQLPGGNSRVKRQNAGQHWYVSTEEHVDNNGGVASMSMFKAFVAENDDFSLLQTAVIRNNVPSIGLQTVESGWINYPDQTANPHLFTFFTTNNYQSFGDNVCGWNTDVKGWVQVDDTYYPGIELTPLSVVDGDQHELQVRYQLVNGSWWLGVNGKWAGYYPAKLFTRGSNQPEQTLESSANQINWYGEIAQSEDAQTTTDMGSGHFAKDGYGKAAYLRNLKYTDTGGADQDYDGSSGTVVSDPKRYSIDAYWDQDAQWGNHFFLGGPGAGGQIGA